MKKNHLLTPGPTPIPESVISVFAKPIIHHRTPAFQAVFQEVRKGLKHLFQTEQEVLLLSSTGTGAMDAAVSNTFCRHDSVIVIHGGKFGERWTQIARAYELNPIEILIQPGHSLDPEHLRKIVKANPQAKGILFQASETSTGTWMPTQEICEIANNAGMLAICDAITACGVYDLPMDKWGIDILITGSQKALMIPPGLAMIALSKKAWAMNEKSNLPKFYFDLRAEFKAVVKNQTAWTPAISLIQGLQESLRIIQEEGLPQVFKRHERLARATRKAVEALGLKLLSTHPSPSVTAVIIPPEIKDGKMIPKLMSEKHGVTIVGGQDELEGKIIRLSHFGYCDDFDVTTAIAALERVLHDLGYPVEFGKGVGAALRSLAEH